MYTLDIFYINTVFGEEECAVKLRILDILAEKGKTKYWLYIQLGLSYQNFNRLVNNETKGIKFENMEALCDILECTPNDLFYEYHSDLLPDQSNRQESNSLR